VSYRSHSEYTLVFDYFFLKQPHLLHLLPDLLLMLHLQLFEPNKINTIQLTTASAVINNFKKNLSIIIPLLIF